MNILNWLPFYKKKTKEFEYLYEYCYQPKKIKRRRVVVNPYLVAIEPAQKRILRLNREHMEICIKALSEAYYLNKEYRKTHKESSKNTISYTRKSTSSSIDNRIIARSMDMLGGIIIND